MGGFMFQSNTRAYTPTAACPLRSAFSQNGEPIEAAEGPIPTHSGPKTDQTGPLLDGVFYQLLARSRAQLLPTTALPTLLLEDEIAHPLLPAAYSLS